MNDTIFVSFKLSNIGRTASRHKNEPSTRKCQPHNDEWCLPREPDDVEPVGPLLVVEEDLDVAHVLHQAESGESAKGNVKLDQGFPGDSKIRKRKKVLHIYFAPSFYMFWTK